MRLGNVLGDGESDSKATGRGGAGGKASGGTGDLPEPYPGGEVAVYQKRSDHGVRLPHGIVQHPAGAGVGLSEIDKGNIGQHRTIWQEGG